MGGGAVAARRREAGRAAAAPCGIRAAALIAQELQWKLWWRAGQTATGSARARRLCRPPCAAPRASSPAGRPPQCVCSRLHGTQPRLLPSAPLPPRPALCRRRAAAAAPRCWGCVESHAAATAGATSPVAACGLHAAPLVGLQGGGRQGRFRWCSSGSGSRAAGAPSARLQAPPCTASSLGIPACGPHQGRAAAAHPGPPERAAPSVGVLPLAPPTSLTAGLGAPPPLPDHRAPAQVAWREGWTPRRQGRRQGGASRAS